MKKLLNLSLCFIVIFGCLFRPISVRSEEVSATYFPLSANTCLLLGKRIHKTQGNELYYTVVSSVNVRIVRAIRTSESSWDLFLVSPVPFNYGYSSNDSLKACNVTLSAASAHENYYFGRFSVSWTSSYDWEWDVDIPIISLPSSDYWDDIIDITYGDGAIDPPLPGPVYSGLSDLGYSTNIAGSGAAAIQNVDTVQWNPSVDVNGNDISNGIVTVRAVPGKYSAADRATLAEKVYTDFVLDTLGATELGTVSVSAGGFKAPWSTVIDKIALPFASIESCLKGDEYWFKNGWVYQIRYTLDDFTSDWQTVYTATSSGVSNDLTIINTTSVNTTLFETFQIINQINQTTNNNTVAYNYQYGDVNISVENYTGDPDQDTEPWWTHLIDGLADIIAAIVDGISRLVAAIVGLVGDLIDGILGLFTFDSFTVNNYNQEINTIKQNSGIFGEAIDFSEGLKNTFEGVEYADPEIHYPGITLDNVQIIPALDVNLNDYVSDLGLSDFRQVAYLVTDGTIYLSLVVLVVRRLMAALKGQ